MIRPLALRPEADEGWYCALFNTTAKPREVTVRLEQLPFQLAVWVRDVWKACDLEPDAEPRRYPNRGARGGAATADIVRYGSEAIMRSVAALLMMTGPVSAQQTAPALPAPAVREAPVPQLVSQGGQHALFVDGAPFLVLGAQAHNSSAWRSMLPKAWPVMNYLGVNTVELTVYWE